MRDDGVPPQSRKFVRRAVYESQPLQQDAASEPPARKFVRRPVDPELRAEEERRAREFRLEETRRLARIYHLKSVWCEMVGLAPGGGQLSARELDEIGLAAVMVLAGALASMPGVDLEAMLVQADRGLRYEVDQWRQRAALAWPGDGAVNSAST
jgi:hypothetical protein